MVQSDKFLKRKQLAIIHENAPVIDVALYRLECLSNDRRLPRKEHKGKVWRGVRWATLNPTLDACITEILERMKAQPSMVCRIRDYLTGKVVWPYPAFRIERATRVVGKICHGSRWVEAGYLPYTRHWDLQSAIDIIPQFEYWDKQTHDSEVYSIRNVDTNEIWTADGIRIVEAE